MMGSDIKKLQDLIDSLEKLKEEEEKRKEETEKANVNIVNETTNEIITNQDTSSNSINNVSNN